MLPRNFPGRGGRKKLSLPDHFESGYISEYVAVSANFEEALRVKLVSSLRDSQPTTGISQCCSKSAADVTFFSDNSTVFASRSGNSCSVQHRATGRASQTRGFGECGENDIWPRTIRTSGREYQVQVHLVLSAALFFRNCTQ